MGYIHKFAQRNTSPSFKRNNLQLISDFVPQLDNSLLNIVADNSAGCWEIEQFGYEKNGSKYYHKARTNIEYSEISKNNAYKYDQIDDNELIKCNWDRFGICDQLLDVLLVDLVHNFYQK